MNIEKIEIQPGQYVWVDTEAEINENDFILTKDNRIVEVSYLLSSDLEQASKIIAASPFLNLEGIPDYVEWLANQYWSKQPYNEDAFIKGYQAAEQEIKNDRWLSPIDTERKWQEEKLVEIFYHYPNASPAWQYMNGLIHIALESKNKFTEEDLNKAIELARLREHIMGLFIYEPEQIIEQIKSEKK